MLLSTTPLETERMWVREEDEVFLEIGDSDSHLLFILSHCSSGSSTGCLVKGCVEGHEPYLHCHRPRLRRLLVSHRRLCHRRRLHHRHRRGLNHLQRGRRIRHCLDLHLLHGSSRLSQGPNGLLGRRKHVQYAFGGRGDKDWAAGGAGISRTSRCSKWSKTGCELRRPSPDALSPLRSGRLFFPDLLHVRWYRARARTERACARAARLCGWWGYSERAVFFSYPWFVQDLTMDFFGFLAVSTSLQVLTVRRA